jgi:hypothetical protein
MTIIIKRITPFFMMNPPVSLVCYKMHEQCQRDITYN